MFLGDENLPVLPEWEEQIKQLEEIKETASAAGRGRPRQRRRSDAEPRCCPESRCAAGARAALPFTFAKQYGVLLDQSAEAPLVVHQGQPACRC